MSHQITSTDTTISYLQTPWHELSDVFNEPIASSAEMMAKYPGLDYQIGLRGLQTTDPDCTLLRHRCTYRVDTNENFRPVGPDWRPLQNRDAVAWFDPWIANGAAVFETAGSLKGGRVFWVLAKWLGGAASYDVGDGDVVQPYVLLIHAHDGSLAIYAGVTTVRVVCWNTASMALELDSRGRPRAKGLFRVHHRPSAMVTLDKVRASIEDTNASIENTVERFRKLAKRKVGNGAWIRFFVDAVMGRSEAAQKKGEWGNPKVAEQVEQFFESGVGQDLSSAKGTTWGMYNALTEFVTHHQGKSVENRALGLLPGQEKDRLLQRALDVAWVMSESIPLDAVLTPDQLDRFENIHIAAQGAALPAAAVA
jgi:phage/plasmid-like protein (TIGR03299 family)